MRAPLRAGWWTLLGLCAAWCVPVVANAAIVTADIECSEPGCTVTVTPDPITLRVGDGIHWNVFPSCSPLDNPNCSGQCTLTIDPGPVDDPGTGHPGETIPMVAPSVGNPSTPFTKPGLYTYSLACSPPIVGQIVVMDVVPTLSTWALLGASLALIGTGILALARRRRRVA